MEERTERAYSAKEVFTTLDIGDSTLRKWCLSLEKNGYKFFRDGQNRRLYVEGDLVVLRHFQKLVQEHNTPLENAAKLVVDRFGKGAFEVRTPSVPVESQRDLDRSTVKEIEELKELVTNQNELIKELITRMDQQQKYIDERLNKRDELLMKTIREQQQETQKLIAAAEEKKKGFWNRLFKK